MNRIFGKRRPFQPLTGRACWGVGMALAALLLLAAWLFGGMRYAVPDDTFLLRSMAGFDSPEIPRYNLYLHGLLLYPLRWLGLAFPGVGWFSWLQLALLWLAASVMFKSALQRFALAQRPLWQGLVCLTPFAAVFLFYSFCRVTYTSTAGVLGGAAAIQLLSFDADDATDGRVVRSSLFSLVLMSLGYALRQITLLPTLAFCGVAFLVQASSPGRRKKPRGLRPLAVSLLITAAVLAMLAGVRELENAGADARDYLAWQKQSIRVRDYHNVSDLPQAVLDANGWSPAEQRLIQQWYYMDENISAEAFARAADEMDAQAGAGVAQRLAGVGYQLRMFAAREPLGRRMLWALAGLGAMCLFGLCLPKRAGGATALGVLSALFLCAGLLCYLASQGRMPLRAVLTAALPCAAILLGLLPACLPRSPAKAASVALALAAACCLWLCARCLPPMIGELAHDEEAQNVALNESLDSFAAAHPELLLVRDNTFGNDLRLFPSTQNGIPQNLLYWGGWSAHSPAYDALLKRFGFDPWRWNAQCFHDPRVRFLRASPEEPTDFLLYLNQTCSSFLHLDEERDGVYCFSVRGAP